VISANELVGIRIDTGGSTCTWRNTLRQSGTFNQGSLNGNAIGRGSREAKANSDNPVSEALVAQIVTSGNENISFTEDVNSGGNVVTGVQQSGMYSVSPDSRTTFNLASGAEIVCYLVTTNRGLLHQRHSRQRR
jgi:D-alanyl-D-alanine carboxypeptidase